MCCMRSNATEALDCLDKALALRPGDLDTLLYRGNALSALDRTQEAISCFDAVLARNPRHDPGYSDTLLNRGTALAKLGRHTQALADFDAIIAHAPNHVGALYNRGTAQLDLNRYARALETFDRMLAHAPQHARAWNNRGRALQALNRHQDAVASFEKAIALEKDNADAHSNLALSLLTLGELQRGFAQYEWRWKRAGMPDTRSGYRGRLWLGEFRSDNGLSCCRPSKGSATPFNLSAMRHVWRAPAQRSCSKCSPSSKRCSRVSKVLHHATRAAKPCPPMTSIARSAACLWHSGPANEIPADIPYLRADDAHIAKWRPTIEALPGKRVALAWAGHARHPNDRNRSIDLKLLEPLFALEGVSFIGIQRDLRENDASLLARHPNVTHVGDKLADMADTAAIVAMADLTIAVDTSVVHLAGAMGARCGCCCRFHRTGDGRSPASTPLGIRRRDCFANLRSPIGLA